jgi:hypothetical protein
MKPDEYNKFVELINKLSKAFKYDLDSDNVKLYWKFLNTYKLSVIENAINYILFNRVYKGEVLLGEITKAMTDYKEDPKFSNHIK